MYISNIITLIATFLLIITIRMLSSPTSAYKGNLLGIFGVLIIISSTLIQSDVSDKLIILLIIISGSIIGTYFGLKVKITSLPQMIAIFNSLGGLSAVCISLSEELSFSTQHIMNLTGLIIGGITFTGSIMAFTKLQGIISSRPLHYPFQSLSNIITFFIILILSSYFLYDPNASTLIVLSLITFLAGILLLLPVGGADMPVIISILNAFSGWATVGIGFSLSSATLIIIGSIVGFSGTILSFIMMKSMHRNLKNILTGSIITDYQTSISDKITHEGSPEDAAFIMKNAQKIIIVPGYGMAVSQAQHSLKNMTDILRNKYHITVKFAIHPVAGRMPGHMNILLAEANIDYKDVFELNDINNEFSNTDVAYVIGANDITNPLAKSDASSPIYQMPILEVEKAKTVFFVKRSLNRGYSGIDNPLFYASNTIMLYGDAKEITDKIIKNLET